MKKILLLAIFTFVFLESTKSQSRKVIIDCDPGIDDAMALVYALQSPELEVIGITTVFGNTPTQLSTKNALIVSELVGKIVPVYEGAFKPLVLSEHRPTDYVHGADGLGNSNWSKPTGKKQSKKAVNYLIETCKNNPGEITIITLGPLTNLALAHKLDSGFSSSVKEVIVMGGAIHTNGNVSPAGEANIFIDPHAADVVLSAPWKVSMIGLDVTSNVVVNSSLFEKLKKSKPQQADFLISISKFYSKFYASVGVENGFLFHDPTAIIYFTHPEFFETISGPVRVVTEGMAMGKTIINTGTESAGWAAWYKKPSVTVTVGVAPDKVREEYMNTILASTPRKL